MILLNDEGHAGWRLAETLDMEESNLNPLLKKLEKRNFIYQGPPRKSNRPKKPERIVKREGDYKEFPYYINKDLKIFETIIKEMVVANRSYDIGFPYRVIRASDYMKSMRKTFGEDFNVCLTKLLYNLNICKLYYSRTAPNPIITNKSDFSKFKQLHFLKFNERLPLIEDRKISEELLKELEIWWIRYDLTMCCNKDPINFNKLIAINWDIPGDYIFGADIQEAIINAIKKLPEPKRSKLFHQFKQ
jgi:hypothetical protein